eukprot:6218251-Prymnesium_polylepis.1
MKRELVTTAAQLSRGARRGAGRWTGEAHGWTVGGGWLEMCSVWVAGRAGRRRAREGLEEGSPHAERVGGEGDLAPLDEEGAEEGGADEDEAEGEGEQRQRGRDWHRAKEEWDEWDE